MVSTGLNRAIRAARGRLIVRMDAHTKYASDYLVACVEAKEKTGADNVGGPWKAVGKGLVGEAIAASFHSRLSTGGGGSHNLSHEGPVDTVYLGCWDRGLFDRVGGFDEQLVRNQDDELNLRIVRSGGRVWQSPAIHSEYECRSSLRKLARQFYQYGYWKVRVIQKHAIPASLRHLAPAIALSFIATISLAAVLSPAAALLAAIAWTGYVAAISAESLRLASKHGWRLWPAIVATFPCYHFGYGIGFMHGLLDFVVLHRDARASSLKLSR
jgi:succinoglycan biosynthesis protein ExoA